jgi:hypothetical protein
MTDRSQPIKKYSGRKAEYSARFRTFRKNGKVFFLGEHPYKLANEN